MPSKTSGAARTRRQRRGRMRQRYSELSHESPIVRIQTMYEEFGPFWARLMLKDTVLTKDEILSDRYQRWYATQPRM